MTENPQLRGGAERDLDGKVAVVTGGSRGIGRAVAAALLRRGVRVAIGGRSASALQEAQAALQPAAAEGATTDEPATAGTGAGAGRGGDRLLTVQGDVTSEPDATKLISDAAAKFGGLDILVNNAGIGRFAPVAEMTTDAWQEVLQTNLTGPFLCSRAAIPHLRQRGGGWIVNISSLASENPFIGAAAYSASKAALNAFTETLMLEVRHDGIRVSMVLPGSVQTAFSGDETRGAEWKLSPDDVARVVMDLIGHPSRSLPSRVDLRPSRPPKRG